MHTRRSYNAEDAVAVLSHVQRFLKMLVSKWCSENMRTNIEFEKFFF